MTSLTEIYRRFPAREAATCKGRHLQHSHGTGDMIMMFAKGTTSVAVPAEAYAFAGGKEDSEIIFFDADGQQLAAYRSVGTGGTGVHHGCVAMGAKKLPVKNYHALFWHRRLDGEMPPEWDAADLDRFAAGLITQAHDEETRDWRRRELTDIPTMRARRASYRTATGAVNAAREFGLADPKG